MKEMRNGSGEPPVAAPATSACAESMSASRRAFLRGIPVLTVGAVVAPPLAQAGESAHAGGQPGAHWGMLVDVRKCIGCQACTVACIHENAVPDGSFRTIVSTYSVKQADDAAQPAGTYVLPRLCNHCDNPPCVPVCPVQATFQRSDGIVLVDNERCVGCGYCVQACPYDARFINHETQTADKCTFCEHRLEAGLLPACVESCVGGARVIGDLNDEGSEIRQRMREHAKDLKVLKPAMGTDPHVYYLGLPDAFVDGVDGQASVRLVTSH